MFIDGKLEMIVGRGIDDSHPITFPWSKVEFGVRSNGSILVFPIDKTAVSGNRWHSSFLKPKLKCRCAIIILYEHRSQIDVPILHCGTIDLEGTEETVRVL